MNCCDQDCHQGKDCPIRATRRVRAGRPPDNTGCLPVDYTAQQIEDWDREAAANEWAEDKRFARNALIVIVAFVFGLFGLGMLGMQ